MAKSKDDLIIEQLQRDNKELRVTAGFHGRLVEALDDALADAADNGYESLWTEKARALLKEIEDAK